MAKLKTDPGLCRLTEIALRGFHAKKHGDNLNNATVLYIEDGSKASKVVYDHVD